MASERGTDRPFSVQLDDHDVAHIRFEPNADLRIEHITEIMRAVDDIRDGRHVPVMVHMEHVRTADREARNAAARADTGSAVTLITDSPIGRMIGNFYMLVNKPRTPTKMFTSEQDAFRWIHGLRK